MPASDLMIAFIVGFVTWTGAVVGLTLYLHNKFRSLEVAFYRGLGKHRREIDRQLGDHRGRIQRLEILVGGSSLDRFITVDTSPEHDDAE